MVQQTEQDIVMEEQVRSMMKTINEHGGEGKAVTIDADMGGYDVAAVFEEIIQSWVSQKMIKEDLWETMECLKMLRTVETTCTLLQDAVSVASKSHLETAQDKTKEEKSDGAVES